MRALDGRARADGLHRAAGAAGRGRVGRGARRRAGHARVRPAVAVDLDGRAAGGGADGRQRARAGGGGRRRRLPARRGPRPPDAGGARPAGQRGGRLRPDGRRRRCAPDAAAGRAAAEAASAVVERGRSARGRARRSASCSGPTHSAPGGVGAASLRAGDATVVAVAVANAIGDVARRRRDRPRRRGAGRRGAPSTSSPAAAIPPLRRSARTRPSRACARTRG